MLLQVANNLQIAANLYKRELDEGKKSNIVAEISGLDQEVRQKIIDELLAQGHIQLPVEKKKSKR